MKFTQPCLVMTIENNQIDWAFFIEPNEEYTKEDAINMCDRDPDIFYVYPIKLNKTTAVAESMDYINDILTIHKPDEIPGVFEL